MSGDSLIERLARPELAVLDIAASPIGDPGAGHIAAAGWKLQKLYPPRTKIESAGL